MCCRKQTFCVLFSCSQRDLYLQCIDIGQSYLHSETTQRPKRWNLIQTNLTTRPLPQAKTLQKKTLPYISNNMTRKSHQYGFKDKHSIITALRTLINPFTTGFNRKHKRIVAIELDASKAFDMVDTYKQTHKLNKSLVQNDYQVHAYLHQRLEPIHTI